MDLDRRAIFELEGASVPAQVDQPGGEDGVDADRFRDVVGRLASGVTVVTTQIAGVAYGMTASSVTSLSLDPPLMLICLNNAGPTTAAVAQAHAYAVNVLGHGSQHLAHQFSQPNSDKFRSVAVMPGTLGIPLLIDALAHIECRVVEQVVGGSHTIFIGQVTAAGAREGSPLTYFRGNFGRFEFGRDDGAYLRARELVLNRHYAPDSEINLDVLADELAVDSAGAFYALTRLALDRLVRRDVERGYVVVPFDASTSGEAFDARTAIEIGVIELTIGRAEAADLASLRERFERMAAMLVGDRFVDFEEYLDANYAFHEFMVSLAHNPPLTAAFGQLGLRAVMARSFGATPVTSERFVDAQRGLVEAFERGDAAMAKNAVRRYGELAKERTREIFDEIGGRL